MPDPHGPDNGPTVARYLAEAKPLVVEVIEHSERVNNDTPWYVSVPGREAVPASVLEFVFQSRATADEQLRLGAVLEGLAFAIRSALGMAEFARQRGDQAPESWASLGDRSLLSVLIETLRAGVVHPT